MKAVYTIALVWSFAAFCFTKCKIDQLIQVKEIAVTLTDIKEGTRENRGQMYWLTWRDENQLEYVMFCPCPQYKIGDKRTFLITR